MRERVEVKGSAQRSRDAGGEREVQQAVRENDASQKEEMVREWIVRIHWLLEEKQCEFACEGGCNGKWMWKEMERVSESEAETNAWAYERVACALTFSTHYMRTE